jgi:hypothetical protein
MQYLDVGTVFDLADIQTIFDHVPHKAKLIRKDFVYKKNPWLYFASELYRPSDRRLSAKSVQTFADPYGRNLDFLDRSSYFFFQVAPQLYSRG